MKLFASIGALLFLFIIGCASKPWTPYEFPIDVSSRLKRSTVVVRSYGMPRCSGIFVRPEIILTATHCVYSGLNVEVSRFKTPERFVSAAVIFNHPKSDISILRVKPEEGELTFKIKTDPSEVPDEPVATVGHPQNSVTPYDPFTLSNSDFHLSTGKPIWLKDDELAVAILVQPGNSGGALITQQGEIIGICSKFGPDPYQFPKFETVGFFVGGSALKEANDQLSRPDIATRPELPWTEAESKLYTSIGLGYRTARYFSSQLFPTVGLSFRYAERLDVGLGTAVDFNREFEWYFGRLRAFKLFGTGYSSFLIGAGLFCDKGILNTGREIVTSCRPEFSFGIPGLTAGIQISDGSTPVLALIELQGARWFSSLGY